MGRCAMLLLIFVACALLLLGLGHWSVWSRHICDMRVAAAERASAAAAATLAIAPVGGGGSQSTIALEAEVRRLTAQITYLTNAATNTAGGGRVIHSVPGSISSASENDVAALIVTDPLAPPPSSQVTTATKGKNEVIEPAPLLPLGTRALLVICYNRPDYLKRTLDAVLERLPTHNRPHIFVSQDGNDAGVTATIAQAAAAFARDAPDVPFTSWRHPSGALRGRDIPGWATSYYALAQHFGWGLKKIFDAGYARAIVLEDDIEIAIDFFDFLGAMEILADSDPRILAVSAYNDLGQPAFVADARQVYRSDFFPGLGWMIGRRSWEELSPKWPEGFWDDWLREPAQRKDRHFLRPEISRTITFGAKGVSGGQFSSFLSNIKLNDDHIDWSVEDIRYLSEPAWDVAMMSTIKSAQSAINLDEFVKAECTLINTKNNAAVSFPWKDQADFVEIAGRFGFITDEKAGIQRTAYKGVVTFKHNGCRKLIISNPSQFS